MVDGGQRGQGLLAHFGSRCLVVTAAHVLQDSTYAVISNGTPGTPAAPAGLARLFPFDVAVLEPNVEVSECHLDLADLGAAGPLDGELTLRIIEPSGLMAQHSVAVVSDDGILVHVRPMGAWTFQAGMSGATLAADDHPVAMLLAVLPDGVHGEAIRLDVAARWMIPFLRPRPVATLDPAPQGIAAPDTLSDPEAGASVTTTAAPQDDHGDPRTLLTGPTDVWRGRIVARPVEVVIDLAGEEAGQVRCVMVEPGPETPPYAMPRTIAVFYRVGSSHWRQEGWGEPSLVDGTFRLSRGLGFRASAIKLELGDPVDGSTVLEIGRISVLSRACPQ